MLQCIDKPIETIIFRERTFMSHSTDISIGLLLFPALTQLDLTGPYEVFTRAPDTKVHLNQPPHSMRVPHWM